MDLKGHKMVLLKIHLHCVLSCFSFFFFFVFVFDNPKDLLPFLCSSFGSVDVCVFSFSGS